MNKILDNMFLLTVFFIIVFIVLHLILPVELINAISDNFNKVAIGIAALITTYFGSSYLRDELSRKRSIGYYKKKYPPENYKKTFRIIESEDTPGAIFLHDLESLNKHHIWNMKTVYDLGWQTFEREALPKEDFLSYPLGDPIRTRGDLGE